MLKTKSEIKSWLEEMEIENFTINQDLCVDVAGSVILYDKNLTSIPVQFNQVDEEFNCMHNQLISLKGSPRVVKGDFNCCFNKLLSLEEGPVSVGGVYACADNQLTSLKGVPTQVGHMFDCSNNFIESLEFAPCCLLDKNSEGQIFCAINNPLTTLANLPTTLEGTFYISENDDILQGFKDAFMLNEGLHINFEHLHKHFNIINFKHQLDNTLKVKDSSFQVKI